MTTLTEKLGTSLEKKGSTYESRGELRHYEALLENGDLKGAVLCRIAPSETLKCASGETLFIGCDVKNVNKLI